MVRSLWGYHDMVICMDSSISSTAFMEHLLSLFPQPASCMRKRREVQTKAVKWKNISSPDLTTYVTNEESLKLAVLRRRSRSNQILYQLEDFWLFHKLSYSSQRSCRTLRQDVYMISPFPWPLVHKYTTLDSIFWTLSRGFHGKSRKLYAISPCRLIMRTRNKSYF